MSNEKVSINDTPIRSLYKTPKTRCRKCKLAISDNGPEKTPIPKQLFSNQNLQLDSCNEKYRTKSSSIVSEHKLEQLLNAGVSISPYVRNYLQRVQKEKTFHIDGTNGITPKAGNSKMNSLKHNGKLTTELPN